jgi:hypothetical protein
VIRGRFSSTSLLRRIIRLSPGRRSSLRKREIAVEYLSTVECLYAVERLLRERIAVELLYTVEYLYTT